ncbi:MAG: hypothetical protein ACRDS0_18040 [Pseudonocardiaceae bacterium]
MLSGAILSGAILPGAILPGAILCEEVDFVPARDTG